MVRFSTVAALSVIALVSGVTSLSNVEHQTEQGTTVHANSKAMDPKFLGPGGPNGFAGPLGYGSGFGGALGFCQSGFLGFMNGAIGSFGPGMAIARVQMILQITVARFQMLVQYIQALQCFTCGIPNPQIIAFTQVAITLFIRIQTLFGLVQQFYMAQWATLQQFILPLNTLIPSFFGLCNGFGLQGALGGASLFNPLAFGGFGLTSVQSCFSLTSVSGGAGGLMWKANPVKTLSS